MKFIKLNNESFLKIKSDQIDSINLFFYLQFRFYCNPKQLQEKFEKSFFTSLVISVEFDRFVESVIIVIIKTAKQN